MALDGSSFALPAPARWLMSMLMKKKFLTKGIPAGFQTTKEMIASDDTSLEDALDHLRRSIERQGSDADRAMHPAFGRITADEWNQFNLRHAEEHMSFLAPADSD